MLGLFFKVLYFSVFVGDDDTEALCFFHGNGHSSYGDIRIVFLMEVQHHFVIHFVDMVTGKNEYIIGIIALHVLYVLVDRICRSGIPFAVDIFLKGRKYGNAADITVQIPGGADTDMGIQLQRLVLSEDTNRIYSGINTVTERKINDPVLSSKRYCGLCHVCSQNTESASLSSC